METSVTLSGENFNEFLRVLSLLKEACNDVDVREGIIRQRSNENSCIFQIDLTTMFPEMDIPITDIKQKFDLLKIFSDQEVTVSVNDEYCTFNDQFSSLSFKKPNLDYIDNKFMTETEINATFTLDDDHMLLSTEIPTTISDRISAVRQGFNVDTVQVNLQGELAMITAKTQAKDQSAKLMEGIVTEMTIHSKTDLLIVPFIIDHDGDMEFKMFNVQEGVAVNKFDTSIGDMDIIVYSRSSLEEVEATETPAPPADGAAPF